MFFKRKNIKKIRKGIAAVILAALFTIPVSLISFASVTECGFCHSHDISMKGSFSVRYECNNCGAYTNADGTWTIGRNYDTTKANIEAGNLPTPIEFRATLNGVEAGLPNDATEGEVTDTYRAELQDTLRKEAPAIYNYLNSNLDNIVKSAFVMDTCCGSLKEWFTGSNNKFNAVRLKLDWANNAYSFICKLAICAVFVNFFMSLIQDMENNSLSDERFFFLLGKLLLGIGFAKYGAVVSESIVGLGMAFVQNIQIDRSVALKSVTVQLSDMYANAFDQYLANPTAFIADSGQSILDKGASALLSSFANGYMCDVFIEIGLFTIIAELIIRMLFSPIAIAELFFDGRRSYGFRALRGLCASALTPVTIFMFIAILNIIRINIDTSFVSTIALNFTIAASIPAARVAIGAIIS